MKAFSHLILPALLFLISGAAGTTASSPPPPTTGAAGTTASSPPPPITGAAGTTASSPPTPSTGAQSTTAATVTPASSPPTPSTGTQSTTASSPPPSSTGAQSTTAAAGTTASSSPTPSTAAQSTTAAAATTASSPATPSTVAQSTTAAVGTTASSPASPSTVAQSTTAAVGTTASSPATPSTVAQSTTVAVGTTASSPPPPTTAAAGTTASSPPPPTTGAAGTTASSPPPPTTGAAGTTVTKGPTNPCQEDSCKGGSSCVSLNDTFFCLCPEGQYYNSSTCSKGKIFPGTITFKTSNIEDLKDENSVAYQKLHFEITEFFKKAFNNSDYGQTVIVKISLRTSAARSELRAGDKDVDVEVVNIFKETTELNETTVSNAITKAIEDNADVFTGYTEQDRCDYYGCEKKNDQDNCSSGLLCQCKQGLVRPNPQVPMCVAFGPTCDDTCNAENKRQCLVRSSTSADCVCLPGYREDSHGACQPCAFGYSGVGCKDNIYLIITIVGIIAGILILGLLIALVISMSSKSKKKNVEEQNLIENDFHSLRLYETTGFSNLGADGNIFPKVRVNLPKDGSARNPYSN